MKTVTIIAEAGVNHNGDISRALEMIWAAKETGADVIKFQAFTTETIVAAHAPTAGYQADNTGVDNQFDLIKALELPRDSYPCLAEECQKAKISFLATPFDWTMTADLMKLGMPAIKVASGEITNVVALQHFATFGVPIWLATGMCTLEEVRSAVRVLKDGGANDITVMHCTSLYPAPQETLNLRAISTLASALGLPVGYSDHSLGDQASLAAVALNALVIEKHFTLDNDLPGPDHLASLEPAAFKQMVSRIRDLETMLGDGTKRPQAGEPETARLVRRSWHAARDLAAGASLRDGDAMLLRPEGGLAPGIALTGRRLSCNVSAGQPITENVLETA